MVTKHGLTILFFFLCLILAKNHMVTKQCDCSGLIKGSLILAKNHMVTKHIKNVINLIISLILAKNHMVTKLGLT